MHLRKYNITFKKTEKGIVPEEDYMIIEQEYGSRITLPEILPTQFELNQNDKSITRVKYLNTYVTYNNVDYSNLLVETNIILYPIYQTEWQNMNEIQNPPTYYFDTQEPELISVLDGPNSSKFIDNDNNMRDIFEGVQAIIKSDVQVEAICVPQ